MKNWKEWPYSIRNMMVEKVVEPLEIDIISKEAQKRLAWFDYYNNNGQNIRKTCRHFGIHHSTFYFWQRRYDPNNLGSLESRSRRPKNVRKPEIPGQIERLVVKLRREYPAWSKYKLAVILKEERGVKISASSIGRIIKRYGLIEEKASKRRRRAALNPRPRARGTKYKYPGSHVEIDTKHIRFRGIKTYQFTAIDSVTKQRVLRIYPRASSRQGRYFLREVVNDFPFRIITIQTDNGSEFHGEFGQACRRLRIKHCFAYPKSPQQNALVERSHRTDEDEFYSLGNLTEKIVEQQKSIKEWEYLYNNKRPHQALNYLTPNAYFERIRTRKVSGMC